MSGVVLRCPACGTTQSHVGECDACSEEEVKYFCSNHPAGLWLVDPVCTACGARFGDPAPARSKPAPSLPPPLPDAKRRRSPPRAPTPSRIEPPAIPPRGVEPRRPPVEGTPPPSLADLIREMIKEGKPAGYRIGEAAPVEPIAVTPSSGFPVFGCLGKLILLVLLLVALVVFGVFLLVGGAFQGLIY